MLDLAAPTSRAWLDEAVANIDIVLIDHANCEKKAASTALGLTFRYHARLELMKPLSALAREELEHFELCLDIMRARGIVFRSIPAGHYAAKLHTVVRREEPYRLLDTLLVAALIEARSCERMKLLSEHLPDAELAAFYKGLLACEARHFHGYVDLAYQMFPRDEVRVRLHELADHEAEVMREPSELRMHSGAV